MKIISCGVLLVRDGQYLLCHTTNGGAKAWSIPKGMKESSESEQDTAYRECKEETGIDLKALGLSLKEMPEYQYNIKDKTTKVFLCEDDNELTANIKLSCSSMVSDRKDPKIVFPEVDRFAWVSKEQAKTMVFKSQEHIFS